MWNPGLGELQAGIKTAGRNINLRYADDSTLMARSKKGLKNLLMRVEEESDKAGLKLNIQKTNITASGAISLWQVDRGKSGNISGFYFRGGSNITVDGECSHEIKRTLLLGGKAMTNLDSI